jgi:hypothetical protein
MALGCEWSCGCPVVTHKLPRLSQSGDLGYLKAAWNLTRSERRTVSSIGSAVYCRDLLSGGDPLHPAIARKWQSWIAEVRKDFLICPSDDKDFVGRGRDSGSVQNVDVLVDGPYIESQKKRTIPSWKEAAKESHRRKETLKQGRSCSMAKFLWLFIICL